jgi:hypothetical protein
MEFVIVPKGKSWLRGGKDRLGDQEVEIPADFYLGKYEVTQEEWEKVMGGNPSHFSRTGEGKDAVKAVSDADLKRFPVENVSWDQCQIFVAKLNQRENESGWVYRLPTGPEWEYACRGGPMADKLNGAFDFYFAKPTNTLLPEQANFDNGSKRTCKVGSYEANRLGLFDMHGNVWEWCDDTETPRVSRAGAWDSPSAQCGAVQRLHVPPADRLNSVGLRLARVPSGAPSPEAKAPPPAVAPFTDADVKRIAALPAAEQVEEVRKELMRRNPGYDGRAELIVEEGAVRVIRVRTDKVADISPLRVFNAPRVLDLSGFQDAAYRGLGQLADLTPLPGMDLTGLRELQLANNTKLTDASLGCFKGCRDLQKLSLWGTTVGDVGLDNFKECKNLYILELDGTKVTDAGLGLFKDCNELKYLQLSRTQVSGLGLAHFKDCKGLTHLTMNNTPVTDAGLAPLGRLAGLAYLNLTKTQVTAKGVEALAKALPKCKIDWDGGVILPKVGSAPFADADVKRVRALPAEQQVEEVRKELMRRNPGFDGKMKTKIEGGVVTEFSIVTDHVTDIAPIRVFNALRVLECGGTWTNGPSGLLADLTPLQGMAALTHLNLIQTKVTDTGIASLKGCKDLRYLNLNNTRVTDKGLANLKDCPALAILDVSATKVTDEGLAHFKDCRTLTHLLLGGTKVSDAGLAYFKGMPLILLWIDKTDITDLTPLTGMPLETILLTPKNITQGLDILRDMKGLKTIGISWEKTWPAAEFWERFDKGEFKE